MAATRSSYIVALKRQGKKKPKTDVIHFRGLLSTTTQPSVGYKGRVSNEQLLWGSLLMSQVRGHGQTGHIESHRKALVQATVLSSIFICGSSATNSRKRKIQLYYTSRYLTKHLGTVSWTKDSLHVTCMLPPSKKGGDGPVKMWRASNHWKEFQDRGHHVSSNRQDSLAMLSQLTRKGTSRMN